MHTHTLCRYFGREKKNNTITYRLKTEVTTNEKYKGEKKIINIHTKIFKIIEMPLLLAVHTFMLAYVDIMCSPYTSLRKEEEEEGKNTFRRFC